MERVAIFFRERMASLTASESGKVSRRSGAMRTMLVSCCMRLKCLPRTPMLKSREGRGARESSSLAFFILFNLGCDREASSNESDSRFGLSVNDEEDTVPGGHSDGDEAFPSSECWSSGNVEANGS